MDNVNQPITPPQTPDQMHSSFDDSHHSKVIPIIIAIIILILVGVGSYVLGTKNSATVVENKITQTSPTPTPNPTANWKTYANTRRGYSFKYPLSYSMKEDEMSSAVFESVSLGKDVSATTGGGFGGGDALKTGIVISYTFFPSKDISDKALKSEFGSFTIIKETVLDGKNAIEVTQPPQQDPSGTFGRRIFVTLSSGILEISPNIGFEVNSQQLDKYLNEFDQILSTFQFSN